jgi:hypothetical protein
VPLLARLLVPSLCGLVSCSSSSTKTCSVPKTEAGILGDYRKSDLPAGSCRQGESCPEIVTREECRTGLGPAVIYACSCPRGTWQCAETGRSKSVCLPEDDAGARGQDALTNAVDGPSADVLAPGACPGPNPGSCHFGGGPSGVCDHVGHAATCRDGAWICTDERLTPLVPASQCRCFITGSTAGPCRCDNGVAICGSPDAAADR